MPNANEKAARIERLAIDVLEEQGYWIHHAVRTPYFAGGRWGSNANDVYGCIDIIAKRPPGGTPNRTRWIQVTCEHSIAEKVREVQEGPWDPAIDSVEIWRWIGGRGKHTDGRTGLAVPRCYFQVYVLDDGFLKDPQRRLHPQQVTTQPVPDTG